MDCKIALERLKNFWGNSIICGHNIKFDIDFLNRTCEQINMNIIDNGYVDTMDIYSRVAKKKDVKRKLINVAEYCGLEVEQQHRGIEDYYLIKNVYEILRNESE